MFKPKPALTTIILMKIAGFILEFHVYLRDLMKTYFSNENIRFFFKT